MNLYWLQCGGCGGDSMSMLNMDSPELVEFSTEIGLNLLWHPSLSNGSMVRHEELLEKLLAAELPLDILCVEGFVITGPDGSGSYDLLGDRSKLEIVRQLAGLAGIVVAVGTCAAYGGIGPVEVSGLQFKTSTAGGVLGAGFRSVAGIPVINLPGCPCHYAVLADLLLELAEGRLPELNALQAPHQWFDMLVHQGCLRNEYHEFRVEEREFGERGCLFFYRGCRGPLTSGPCNKLLWNRRSSKTNVGVPCVGCTDP
ncbi:MAG: NADH:ubiquinone oxidoreductase, partial [Deltaproteobacteria bacterium]|nr:NADH:ubiquinone oxidoreductase [Deltaproteobacteria bacterium]